MAHILRHDLLFKSPTASITDFRCRPSHVGSADEERTSSPTVAFVRSGAFVKHTGGDQTLADVNHVILFNPQEPFRVSHPVAGGDDCTAVSFRQSIAEEVLAAPGGSGRGPASPFLDERRARPSEIRSPRAGGSTGPPPSAASRPCRS
jgi:hypothetical protein